MCSQVTSTRVISTNYPQAAGSHGPHRSSACIMTYPHPRQSFSPVLRVADGPNLRDPIAGCNLHPAWNEAMCIIGQSRRWSEREERDEKRAEGEKTGPHSSRFSIILPLSLCREHKITPRVASPWGRKRSKRGRREKEKRKGINCWCRELTESLFKSGPWIPPPGLSVSCSLARRGVVPSRTGGARITPRD